MAIVLKKNKNSVNSPIYSEQAKPKNSPWVAGPGRLAICRVMAGDDLAAGALLYRIVGLWEFQKKKLQRFDREWLALSRYDWAKTTGLTLAEYDKRAAPRLKEHCVEIVKFETMRLTPSTPNIVWINLDYDGFREAEQNIKDNWELASQGMTSKGIGYNKEPKFLGKSEG